MHPFDIIFIQLPLLVDDEEEDEDVFNPEDKEKSKKQCAAEEERERVNVVLTGLGEVLEQVKEVSE